MFDIFIGTIFFALVYFSYRYTWWKKTIDYRFPRILMYHMIREPIKGKKFNSLRVSPKQFESQLHYLKKNGWTSFTMSEAYEKRHKLPEKSVVLTFDDGYQDNLINALPLLKKYGFKATLYLVNDRFDRDWSVYRKLKNKGAGLKEEPKLKDTEVELMIQSGLIEIGSHTLTHANLPALEEKQKRVEICKSKQMIEEQFSLECTSFAYPFGMYDETDKKIVQQCGFTHAVTTKPGIVDLVSCHPYEIPRITISGKDSMLSFVLKLRQGKRGIKK